MDPNATLTNMLHHMYVATRVAQTGGSVLANLEWQEVRDSLSDLMDWLEKGGFPPTLSFNYELFD